MNIRTKLEECSLVVGSMEIQDHIKNAEEEA
jgi:hypothetical protein